MAYGIFADYYDLFTENVNYPERCEYLLSLFEKFDRRPDLLLDLACGTGGFSFEFEKHGIDVIGADMSPDMLSYARQKADEAGSGILFICQRACELELHSRVDGAVCCLDSLNHITDYDELCLSIKRVAEYLERDRLFIFDVNSLYKHRRVLADNAFVYEGEGVFLAWQNELVNNRDINIYLDFFIERDGVYSRYSEDFTERGYSDEEICAAVSAAGLKVEAVLGEMSYDPPEDSCERIIYVTRKV